MVTDVSARMHEGCRLARCGQYEDALREFLWCWDHGLEDDSHFSAVRLSFLLGYMKALAEEYPRCHEEMSRRKAALQQRLTMSEDDSYVSREIAALDRRGF